MTSKKYNFLFTAIGMLMAFGTFAQQGGTYDASRFGLVSGDEILGIVIESSMDEGFCQYKKEGMR